MLDTEAKARCLQRRVRKVNESNSSYVSIKGQLKVVNKWAGAHFRHAYF